MTILISTRPKIHNRIAISVSTSLLGALWMNRTRLNILDIYL